MTDAERAHKMNTENRLSHPIHPGFASSNFPSPPQPLRGPGSIGRLLPSLPDCPLPVVSHKRRRTTSPEPAAMGGYGPILGGDPDDETGQVVTDPSPAVKFTGRKNAAYDIWAFTRAVNTNEDILPGQWPNDYDQHLAGRPDSLFVGCKLCSQFG